jgi:hypothetical protein
MDTQSSPAAKQPMKRSRRKLYAAVSAVAVVIILSASFVFVPPGETMDFWLSYSIGERMVYNVTEVVVNQKTNTSIAGLPQATGTNYFNSTIAYEVMNITNGCYIIDETQAPSLTDHGKQTNPTTLNVSINPCYSVLIPQGGPLIFFNASNNPTIAAYLEETSIRTGAYVWTLPLNCANASLGLTGQVIVAFVGIEEVTVPAGTYRAVRITITSSNLTVNPDSNSPYPKGMTLQFNATTYLEKSTCRLIKTELTQETHLSGLGIENTTTVHIEEALIQYTKPQS